MFMQTVVRVMSLVAFCFALTSEAIAQQQRPKLVPPPELVDSETGLRKHPNDSCEYGYSKGSVVKSTDKVDTKTTVDTTTGEGGFTLGEGSNNAGGKVSKTTGANKNTGTNESKGVVREGCLPVDAKARAVNDADRETVGAINKALDKVFDKVAPAKPEPPARVIVIPVPVPTPATPSRSDGASGSAGQKPSGGAKTGGSSRRSNTGRGSGASKAGSSGGGGSSTGGGRISLAPGSPNFGGSSTFGRGAWTQGSGFGGGGNKISLFPY
jgi:hypothetical protein